jgi:glycosyltransferase involved in cell wall biosynthesis
LTAAAGWHATSEDEAEDIRRLGFTRPICVAPNGVVVPSEADLARAHAHWRSLIPAVTRKRVALFYSRFHEKKRVLELIERWLARVPADWLLVLVGIPESYSVAELRSHIERRGGTEHVMVFDGTNQPPPYAVASLFVLPSHSENFGLSIAEALAAGVPTVVTDATPWKALAAREAGWCVSWEAYPATLHAACAEPASALRARGERGRAWMREAFSWEASAGRLVAFYQRIQTSSTAVPPQ